MELKTSTKNSFAICRCCLSEGCSKELSAVYFFNGQTETYGDMLMECFDVCVSQHADGPGGLKRHICEICINRLRDAVNFKKQVQDCENKFVDMLARGVFKGDPIHKSELKEEPVLPLEDSYDNFEDASDTDEEPLLNLKNRQLTVSTLPTESTEVPASFDVKVESEDCIDEPVTAVSSTSLPPDLKSRRACNMRRRENLRVIFNNTTMMPFKWRSQYRCFFCGIMIKDYKELKRHTEAHGMCSLEDNAIKAVKEGNSDIKVDISDITCRICKQFFPSFDDIIDHLNEKHHLNYDKTDMNVEGYRLADLQCHKCPEKFNSFKILVSHMNKKHPTKSHVCDVCNRKFYKKRNLFVHMSFFHREEGYTCNYCDSKFDNLNHLRFHLIRTHETRSLKPKRLKQEKEKEPSLIKPIKRRHKKMKKEEIGEPVAKESRIEKRERLIRVKENIAAVINMSTAIPFSYYKNKFNCFYCSEDFLDSEALRAHTEASHTLCDVNTKYIRKCCKKVTNISIKLDIFYLKCKVCDATMANMDVMLEHLTTSHNMVFDSALRSCLQPYRLTKDRMECPYCPEEVFRYFNILAKHVNSVHTNNNIVCAYCGITFGKDLHLSVHIRNNHKKGRFKCTICNAECNIQSRLNLHMAKVHGVKAIRCLECGERFGTPYVRQKHMVEVHKNGHKCPFCDRVFVRISFMEEHVRRSHLKEKKAECSVCAMKFFNNIDLKGHMVKHTGEKNFHCDICGERFMYKKSLVRHIGRHKKNSLISL